MRWFSPKHRALLAFGDHTSVCPPWHPQGLLLLSPSPRPCRGLGVSQPELAFVGTAKGSASCQLLCLHMPWLPLASAAHSLQMQQDWREGVGCSHAHTAGFVPGILGKTWVEKEKERLLHSQRGKEGEHDSKDKAPFKPTSKHCSLS